MNGGYDEFRRKNDEMNAASLRRIERDRERDRDRQDTERRHRENLAAQAKARNSSSADRPTHSGAASPISFKGLLLLILAAGGLLLLAQLLPHRGANKAAEKTIAATEETIEEKGVTAKTEPQASENVQPLRNGKSEDLAKPEGQTVGSDADMDGTPSLDELRGPTLRALDSGTATGWNVGRQRGYVTVSTATNAAEKTCRNLTVTAGRRTLHGPSTWCKQSGQEWTEEL